MDPELPLAESAASEPKAFEPAISLPTKTRLVTLSLVTNAADARCSFWFGLSVPGTQSPARLMDVQDVTALLTAAATAGTDEQGPLMLSDTSVEPPRFVFLMPAPGTDFRGRAPWIQELVASLRAWAPEDVGFYIAPEALATPQSLELLLDVLSIAIPTLPATMNYHLLTGGHGLNTVLNAALKLKAEIDAPSLSLYVYH